MNHYKAALDKSLFQDAARIKKRSVALKRRCSLMRLCLGLRPPRALPSAAAPTGDLRLYLPDAPRACHSPTPRPITAHASAWLLPGV